LNRSSCFWKQASAVGARPVLAEPLGFVREGTCSSSRRLIGSRRVLAMNLDTGAPTGKLILNVVGSIAEFEREMRERQREGFAKAKGEGKYKGRKPTAKAKADLRSEARWQRHVARDDRR
jgi:hypothetical protein